MTAPTLPDPDAVRDHIRRLAAEANDYRKLLRLVLKLSRPAAAARPRPGAACPWKVRGHPADMPRTEPGMSVP